MTASGPSEEHGRVAYQGAPGSFSHEACLALRPWDEAVAFAPYASRLPYQLTIAPRRARARFEDDGPTSAALLHDDGLLVMEHADSQGESLPRALSATGAWLHATDHADLAGRLDRVVPPTLRLGDTDRARYLAIGESDRMTLRFVKPR